MSGTVLCRVSVFRVCNLVEQPENENTLIVFRGGGWRSVQGIMGTQEKEVDKFYMGWQDIRLLFRERFPRRVKLE